MSKDFSASMSIHRVRVDEISIVAKSHDGTQWITITLDDRFSIDVFSYDDNFEALCAKFGLTAVNEIIPFSDGSTP